LSQEDRYQYGSKLHEVVLKDGTRILGFISHVDYVNDTFLLLGQNQVGMMGSDGTQYAWADCRSVRAEGRDRGRFSEDMLSAWKRWRHGAKIRS
jgi:hypothetical protein